MSALTATGLALALWAPAWAEPPSTEELEARSAELDARAAELEARAAEIEALLEDLRAHREEAETLAAEREALDAAREEAAEAREEAAEAREGAREEAREAAAEAREVARNNRRRSVHGERIAIGDNAVVAADEEVDEVVAVGGDVDVYGRVLGDATSFGGRVHVHPGGAVDGNAIALGGEVLVDEGAHVGGRVPLSATGELTVDLEEEEAHDRPRRGAFGELLHEVYSHLMFMLSFAGVGVLTVGLFPKRVGRIAHAIEERPVRVAVLGGFVNLMLFAATFFMAVTIIGLPVAALLGLFLALSWLFGFVGLCQAIGDRLPFDNPGHGRWLAFLVGVVVVTFVGALGTLGVLTVIAASVVGMGAAFHTRLGGVA